MIFRVEDFEDAVRDFYESTDLQVTDIERREFMLSHSSRHHVFNTIEELRGHVTKNPPLSITHSLARYFDPGRREPYETKDFDPSEHQRWKMEDKGFAGIDVGFDIDYDHLPNITDYRDGLEKAKNNALRLLDFLTNDLGFQESFISIRFSGNRGFHLVITEESLLQMNKAERTAIENYIRGHEVHLSGFIHTSSDKKAWGNKGGQYQYRFYNTETPGWGGRFTRTFVEMVDELAEITEKKDRLAKIREWAPIKQTIKESTFTRPSWYGDKKEISKGPLEAIHDFLTNEKVLKNISRDWRLSHWAAVEKMSSTALKHLIQMVIQQTQLRKGVEADAITKDLKRQLRTPGSLHTTSGMPCIEITLPMLQDLDKMFEHIRDTIGHEPTEIEVKNEVEVIPLNKTMSPGTYTVPKHEAYSILCADMKAEKENAAATPEEVTAA